MVLLAVAMFVLLVPLIAGLLGPANSFWMLRLPDQKQAADLDGLDFG
jgi:hypothetical protein